MMKKMTRRKFIIDGTLLAGGGIGTLAMGGGLWAPRDAVAAEGDFLETECGKGRGDGKKILVGYSSFCGTTGGVADALGKVFCESGVPVDVRLLKNVKSMEPYRAAVLGSAVRSSAWLPEAIAFVEGNQASLSRIPVAYFLTCLALYRDTEESRMVAKGYMTPVLKAAPLIKPIDTGLFAGVLDYGRLNLVYRMVMKSKMKKKGVPEGDHRNWTAIRSWAEGLRRKLRV